MAGMNKLVANVLFVGFITLVGVGGEDSRAPVAAQAPLPNCTPVIVTLQACLLFVTGKATSPSSACCTAFMEVHYTNPTCLCVLAEPDSTTAMIPDYNLQLAQELPTLCNVPGANIASCKALLGGSNATTPAAGPVSSVPTSPSQAGTNSLRALLISYAGIGLASSSFIAYSRW